MTRVLRWIALTAVATFAAIGAVAYAATGLVSSSNLTASRATVSACDPSGTWTYTFNKDANGRVASVQVASIAAACNGGRISLTLTGTSVNVSGTATTISSCPTTCTVTVPFPTNPPFPADVTSARAVIAGP